MKNRATSFAAVFMIAILWLAVLPTQAKESIEARQILSSYRITPQTESTMLNIAERFEVVHKFENGDFEIYVPFERIAEFLLLSPEAELLLADTASSLFQVQSVGLRNYRTFEEINALLETLSERFPQYVQLQNYGQSYQGRPLYALKISDNVRLDEDEPELMVTSLTHGDEWITGEVLLNLIEEMVTGYNENSRFKNMIDGHELYFIPVVNPDGFVRRERYANGYDPNRAYPWPDKPERNSVTCIDRLIHFFSERDIVGSLDFHAYGRLLMYPWGYTYDQIPDQDEQVMQAVVEHMAEENDYITGPIASTIYVAKGSSVDYYYWQRQTLALAAEVAHTKVPPVGQIDELTDESREMMWRFIEAF